MKRLVNMQICLWMIVAVVFLLAGCGTNRVGDSHTMRSAPPKNVVNTANKNKMMEHDGTSVAEEPGDSKEMQASNETVTGAKDPVEPKMADMPAKPQMSAQANSMVICENHGASQQRYYLKTPDGGKKLVRVRVGASGYGAPPKNYYPVGQRRLMTMRAARVDAYRALAEVVGGLHVWGGTAISDMVLERDRYRTFVDTYVRGARVIDVMPMEDDTYKTTVEMTIDQSFLSQVMAFVDPSLDRLCNKEEGNVSADAGNSNGSFAYYGVNNVSPSFYYSE